MAESGSHFGGKGSSHRSSGQIDNSYLDGERYAKMRRKRRGHPVLVFFLVLILAIVAAGGWCAWQLYQDYQEVRQEAQVVLAQVDAFKEAVKSGDATSLGTSVDTIVAQTDRINGTVHGTLWNMATVFPVVGEDVTSVQTLGDTCVDLVNNGLVPLSNSLQGMELSNLISDHRVNVEQLSALSTAVATVAPVIESDAQVLDDLPEAHIAKVQEYIDRVRDPLVEVSATLQRAEEFLPLLPQVFARGTTRSYLVLAQNNAELRSDGGLPGSAGLLTVTDGYIEMGEFHSMSHWALPEGTSVSATEEELAFFQNITIGSALAEMTAVPNFVRVGELTSEYYTAFYPDGTIDGVIAMDPVVLQDLLALTGSSATVEGIDIDGSNAAQILMHDSYQIFSYDVGSETDEFFTTAASQLVEQLFNNLGSIKLKDLVDFARDMGESHRVLVWMADTAEEDAIDELGFSGSMPQDTTSPELGVYLIDWTWSKIDWYLTCNTSVGAPYDNTDGTTSYDVTTTVGNVMSSEESDGLVQYITGYNPEKAYASDAITEMILMAPYGGSISNIQTSYTGNLALETAFEDWGDGSVWGFAGHTLRMHTPAQGTSVVAYTVTVPADAAEPLSVRQTPLAVDDNGTVSYAWDAS